MKKYPDSIIGLFVLFCFLQKQTVAFHGAFSLLLQCLENLAGEVEQLTLQGGKLALKVFKAITIIQEKRSVTVEVFTVLWYNITLGRRGTPYDGLYGEVLPERCTIFRLQVYERVGVSRVGAYEG